MSEEANTQVTVSNEVQELVEQLITSDSLPVQAKCADKLADVCRTEEKRDEVPLAGGIEPLVNLLVCNDDEALRAALRALGNLTYNHGPNREKIYMAGGLSPVIKALSHTTPKIQRIAAGSLGNIVCNNSDIQEHALEYNVVEKLLRLLRAGDSGDDMLPFMVTTALSNLSANEKALDVIIDQDGMEDLVDVIINSTSARERAIEMLIDVAAKDDYKYPLWEKGEGIRLIKLATKNLHDDEVHVSLMKLIGSLLLNDFIMEDVFENNGVNSFLDIIESAHTDTEPKGLAVMCLGNLARSDNNCLHMVQETRTLSVLQGLLDNDTDSPAMIQYCLSTLKNLAIPPDNKERMRDLIPVIIGFVDHEQLPIRFYAATTIRQIIKGNDENIATASEHKCVEKIVEMGENAINEHLYIEAARVLAQFISSDNDEIKSKVLEHGGLKVLLKLLKSDHEILQTEALRAMLLLTDIPSAQDSFTEDMINAIKEKLNSEDEVKVQIAQEILEAVGEGDTS